MLDSLKDLLGYSLCQPLQLATKKPKELTCDHAPNIENFHQDTLRIRLDMLRNLLALSLGSFPQVDHGDA